MNVNINRLCFDQFEGSRELSKLLICVISITINKCGIIQDFAKLLDVQLQ